MMDFTRELIAAQTHRRMIDAMSLGHRVRPFIIERAPLTAASSLSREAPTAQTNEASPCGKADHL